jgi:hypothetical protein
VRAVLPPQRGRRIRRQIPITAAPRTVRARVVQRLVPVVALLVPRPYEAIATARRQALIGAGRVVAVARSFVAVLLTYPNQAVTATRLAAFLGAGSVVTVARPFIAFLASRPHHPITTTCAEAGAGASRSIAIAITVVTFLVPLLEPVAAGHRVTRAAAASVAFIAVFREPTNRPALTVTTHLVRAAAALTGPGLHRALPVLTIPGARTEQQPRSDQHADRSEHGLEPYYDCDQPDPPST